MILYQELKLCQPAIASRLCLNLQFTMSRLPSDASSPEYDSIEQRHKDHECRDNQVHGEANRSPNRAFYVQPAGPNTLKEIIEIVTEKRRIHTSL